VEDSPFLKTPESPEIPQTCTKLITLDEERARELTQSMRRLYLHTEIQKV
jgi:hypothetical protein